MTPSSRLLARLLAVAPLASACSGPPTPGATAASSTAASPGTPAATPLASTPGSLPPTASPPSAPAASAAATPGASRPAAAAAWRFDGDVCVGADGTTGDRLPAGTAAGCGHRPSAAALATLGIKECPTCYYELVPSSTVEARKGRADACCYTQGHASRGRPLVVEAVEREAPLRPGRGGWGA